MDRLDALKKAVRLADGQTALAKKLGGKVRQGHVWKWLNEAGQAPPEQVIPITMAVKGLVRPYELRPDIYPDPDWLPPGITLQKDG